MSVFSFRTALACALLAPLGLAAQTALPKQSPFAPPGGVVSAGAPNENLEFAGVSSVGQKTDLIIHDKAAKRRHWIGIGDTVEGISVVRYDAGLEQAVIRVNGAEKILPLRKPARAGRGPAPVQPVQTGFSTPPPGMIQTIAPPPPTVASTATPAAAAPANPAAPATPAGPQTPETQAKAETEARMLVSDLLEIGMAQRKAYEEAQRKAAGGANDPRTPAPAPQNPPAVQGQPSTSPAPTPPPGGN